MKAYDMLLEEMCKLLKMGIYYYNLMNGSKSITLVEILYIDIYNAITKIFSAMKLLAVEEFDLELSSSDSDGNSNPFDSCLKLPQ